MKRTKRFICLVFVGVVSGLLLSSTINPQHIYAQAAQILGDADHNGRVQLLDFEVWRTQYVGQTGQKPTTAPTNPPGQTTRSITDNGAVGDGQTDSTVAIQTTLNQAKPGEVVLVPAGTYIQSGTLTVPSGVTLRGQDRETAIIRATNRDKQAIYLRGTKARIETITLTSNGSPRGLSNQHHRVVAERGASEYVVNNIHIKGGSGAGIFSQGGKNYTITNNIVENTLADGIHNTGGSDTATISNNTVINPGDDAIAVVSYMPDGDYTRNITISGNKIQKSQSRGISVVGGQNVKIINNDISDSFNAGIYIACEQSYNTFAAKTLLVEHNTIIRSNSNTAINHAGIFMYSRGGSGTKADGSTVTFIHEAVTIKNNTIADTIAPPWHVAFLDSNAATITFTNNSISGSAGKTPIHNNVPAGKYTISGNTFNGGPL